MKKCEKCGKEFEDSMQSCDACGGALTEEKPQETEEKTFCIYCGGEIAAGDTYCTKCGKSAVEEGKRHCIHCGTPLAENQKFCAKCGAKTNVFIVPKGVEAATEKVTEKVKKVNTRKTKRVCIAVVAVLILALLGKTIQLLTSAEDYLAAGNYAAAYKKAKPEEKKAVLEENLVAVICADVKGNMKDPDSFDLREVWCDLEENCVAIEFGGKNGFGGIVSSFAYYEFDKDEQDYEWQTSVSDLEDEEIYTYLDDANEELEKIWKNIIRGTIKEMRDKKGIKLDDAVIDRINALNEEDLLDDVVLIDEVKELYPTEEDA